MLSKAPVLSRRRSSVRISPVRTCWIMRATKAAILNYSRGSRETGGGKGICVNIVAWPYLTALYRAVKPVIKFRSLVSRRQ